MTLCLHQEVRTACGYRTGTIYLLLFEMSPPIPSHSFACTAASLPVPAPGAAGPELFFCDISQLWAHSIIPSTSLSTSSCVLRACRHTRILSAPLGTVGHVIGRALRPRMRRCAESGRGCGVSTGMIGVGSAHGSGGVSVLRWRVARCAGRKSSDGGMRWRDSSRRRELRKYVLRSRSCCES